MKNKTQENDQLLPGNAKDQKGFIEPLPHENPGKDDRAGFSREDAGDTGRGHKEDHGARDREIRKQ